MKRFYPRLMIRWRLRVIMADRKINNKVLSEKTGIPYSSLSRLKNSDELKTIDGEILNALCHVLNCTPSDLIEFVRDDINEDSSQSRSLA